MEKYVQPINCLRSLLDHHAARLLNIELQLKNELPEWIDLARSIKLKKVLVRYLEFVQEHILKLETFLLNEKITAYPRNNAVMDALIRETNDNLAECPDTEVKHAFLLAAVQEINHFKISAYGTAAAFSNALEFREEAPVFHEAEVNEKSIDDRLSQLAIFEINPDAKSPILIPDNI
jgi:ferritin-like metal-binding protein YciE